MLTWPIGCGVDLTDPTKRSSASKGSKAAAELRERVLDAWLELVESTVVCSSEQSKFCRTCFNDYNKYAKLKSELGLVLL